MEACLTIATEKLLHALDKRKNSPFLNGKRRVYHGQGSDQIYQLAELLDQCGFELKDKQC